MAFKRIVCGKYKELIKQGMTVSLQYQMVQEGSITLTAEDINCIEQEYDGNIAAWLEQEKCEEECRLGISSMRSEPTKIVVNH